MGVLCRGGLQSLAGAVACAGTRVHEKREAEEVCELGGLPDAVSSTEVEAVVDGAMAAVHQFERRRQTRAQYFRRGFFAAAAAACIVLGFLIAWPMESTQGFHAIMSVFLMPMWLLSGAFFPGGDSGWLS